jgi:CheY-like chemotaxis protein
MRPTQTLLCIDDEVTGLNIRKMVFEFAGYRVLTAASGAEGLQLLESTSVDGVLIDFCMPEMDGGQVACRIRQLRPELPILMLTAFPNLPQQALQAVDAHLPKGQPTAVLLQQVSSLLEKLGHRGEGVALDANWFSGAD